MNEITNEMLDEVIKKMEPSRSKPGSLGAVTLILLEELKAYRHTGLSAQEVQQIVSICMKNAPAPAAPIEQGNDDFDLDASIW